MGQCVSGAIEYVRGVGECVCVCITARYCMCVPATNSSHLLNLNVSHIPIVHTCQQWPLPLLSPCRSNYYVRILSTIDRELLKPNASVALHKHSNALVNVLPPEADSSIALLSAEEKPNVSYSDIGE